LRQPAAWGIDIAVIAALLTSVYNATDAIDVLFTARFPAADAGVHVVTEVQDAMRVGGAVRALNELVQRAAAVEWQGTVFGALATEVELVGAMGSSSVAIVTRYAGTLGVDNVARLAGFAALEPRKAGFLVHGAAFVAGLAAHSLKEVRGWHETRGSSSRREHAGG